MSTNLEKNITRIDIQAFQENLIDWFKQEMRDLPWRKDGDPYKVWVSEIMLQQTRVDTVIPYFERFIAKYPTPEAFAEAEDEEVLKIWEGLGYYSRVRNLHAAVKEVVERYEAKVPATPKEIAGLKGVGPYTAGAILSIAYGLPEPAVDGNVMRVLSRILLIYEDIAKPASRKTFEEAVRALISHENPSYFNQGLMELGALICKPANPACLLCPVQSHCLAFNEGVQTQLPVKTRKKKSVHEDRLCAVLRKDGRFLIRKRPDKGLLAQLWEFPHTLEGAAAIHDRTTLTSYLEEILDAEVKLETGSFVKVDHAFTHLTWSIAAFSGEINGVISPEKEFKLVSAEELEKLAFPVSHQKIWNAYKAMYLD